MPLEQRILLHQITPEGVIHDPSLKIPPIPVEAFYGTMGTSPMIEAISTLSPGFHGGNMDAADVARATLSICPFRCPARCSSWAMATRRKATRRCVALPRSPDNGHSADQRDQE